MLDLYVNRLYSKCEFGMLKPTTIKLPNLVQSCNMHNWSEPE